MRLLPNDCRGNASTVATMLGMIACCTSRSCKPCAPGSASRLCITVASLLCRSGNPAVVPAAGTRAWLIGCCGTLLAGAGGLSTAGDGPRGPGRCSTKNQIAIAMITSSTITATHCAAEPRLMALPSVGLPRQRFDTRDRDSLRADTLSRCRVCPAVRDQCDPPLAGTVVVPVGRGMDCGATLPGGGSVVEPLMAPGAVDGAGRVAWLAGTLGGAPAVVAGAYPGVIGTSVRGLTPRPRSLAQ